MEYNLKKAFKDSYKYPESDLSNNIWLLIQERDKKATRTRSFIYTFFSLSSLTGLIFAVKGLLLEFTKLGFYEYASLAFSDSKYVLSNFNEYFLSIVDSIPITNLIVSLVILSILFISIRKVITNKSNQKLLTI